MSNCSISRILHCLEAYFKNVTNMRTDECVVGFDKSRVCLNQIQYHGKCIGVITKWIDNVPRIAFCGEFGYKLNRSQFICQPFVDLPFILHNATYAVYELLRTMSFQDATFFMWVRDKFDCDLSKPVEDIQNRKDNICASLRSVYSVNCMNDAQMEQYWSHFAFAAVYDYKKDENA